MAEKETADQYLERNAKAMEDASELLCDPQYIELVENARSAVTPQEKKSWSDKARKYAASKVDLEALHRHVRAQNKRQVQEGLLPPSILD